MTKRPTRRAAGPRNQSRSAGRVAPPSAAASPPPGFYDPKGPTVRENPLPQQLAAAGERGNGPEATAEHVEAVRAAAVENGATTVDVAIAARGNDMGEDRAKLAADIDRIRGMRRPLGALTQKLALEKRPGYHTHWFNDEGGRIDDALANGWAHRLDKDQKPTRRAVGRGRDSNVLYAYAMDIPEVFWLEDMQSRHQVASEKMESLKAQPFRAQAGQSKPSDSGKFYSPQETEPLTIEKH